MDADLLIPATAALLDGWCGPVVFRWTRPSPGLLGGTTYEQSPGGWLLSDDEVQGDGYGARSLRLVEIPLERIFLDLSRAECRDRVARVLATWCAGPTTAPDFRWDGGDQVWMLGGVAFRYVDVREPIATLLPDGSRLADALALAAIAREVLRG